MKHAPELSSEPHTDPATTTDSSSKSEPRSLEITDEAGIIYPTAETPRAKKTLLKSRNF